jgi:hypothetical protein
MPLEKLNRPLVLFCCFAGLECAKIPAPAGPGILLPRIKAKLARWKFANHTSIIAPIALCPTEREGPQKAQNMSNGLEIPRLEISRFVNIGAI